MNAAGAGCPSALHGGAVLLGFVVLALVTTVLGLACSYPRNPRQQFAGIGLVLAAVVSPLLFLTCFVIQQTAHRDRCGQLPPVASDWYTGLFLACIVVAVVGLALLTATEWAPMLLIAVLDACAVGYACLGLFGRQDRSVVVLFGTHGVCVAVASWWSWRARGREAPERAKASEAGRLLVGGLAAVVLLQVAASSQSATNPVLTNSNLGTVLIATALAVALGTGYTKYVEAMAVNPIRPLPRSSIPPTLQAWAASAAKAYRSGLNWVSRLGPSRPRAAVGPPESPDDLDGSGPPSPVPRQG